MRAGNRYAVTFYKTVTNTDFGFAKELPQGEIRVVADDEQSAASLAKSEFCRRRGLDDWTLHSDRYEVAAVE